MTNSRKEQRSPPADCRKPSVKTENGSGDLRGQVHQRLATATVTDWAGCR